MLLLSTSEDKKVSSHPDPLPLRSEGKRSPPNLKKKEKNDDIYEIATSLRSSQWCIFMFPFH